MALYIRPHVRRPRRVEANLPFLCSEMSPENALPLQSVVHAAEREGDQRQV